MTQTSTGTDTSTLSITCNDVATGNYTISTYESFSTNNGGGLIYSNNPNLKLTINSCNIKNVYSNGTGGMISGYANSITLNSVTTSNVTSASEG